MLLASWIIICFIFFPAKKILESQSEKRAEIIIKAIEAYKEKFGSYPDNLDDKYFSALPLRSCVGSYYCYMKRIHTKDKQPGYEVYYYSFNGRRARYKNEQETWEYYVDD